MATIQQRKQADGKIRYTATIRLRVGGEDFRESRTFSAMAPAKAWIKAREDEIKQGGALASPIRKISIRKLIEDYLGEPGVSLGRSKEQHLKMMTTFDLAEKDAIGLTAATLIEHIRERRSRGTGPATVLNDLIWLRVVWRYAASHRIPVKRAVIDEATTFCKQERLVAKAKNRVRRPTSEELTKIGNWFLAKGERRSDAPPMYDVMWFAIYSCRRQDEICRMRLSDYDRERGTWLVRDVKHPQGSEGHHLEMRVTDRLKPVISAIERGFKRAPGDDRLVPIQSKTLSSYWTKQMHVINILDLHFHDLRHEGCSRLAEDGWTIPQIQQVSLHEGWSALQRYVHVPIRIASRAEWEAH